MLALSSSQLGDVIGVLFTFFIYSYLVNFGITYLEILIVIMIQVIT